MTLGWHQEQNWQRIDKWTSKFKTCICSAKNTMKILGKKYLQIMYLTKDLWSEHWKCNNKKQYIFF